MSDIEARFDRMGEEMEDLFREYQLLVIERTDWKTRAEQAEALVGRLQMVGRDLVMAIHSDIADDPSKYVEAHRWDKMFDAALSVAEQAFVKNPDPTGARLTEEQRALEPRNELEAWLVDREREERAALEKCYETLRTVHPRECPTYGEPGHLDTCRGCIISDALFGVDRVRTDRKNAAVERARGGK